MVQDGKEEKDSEESSNTESSRPSEESGDVIISSPDPLPTSESDGLQTVETNTIVINKNAIVKAMAESTRPISAKDLIKRKKEKESDTQEEKDEAAPAADMTQDSTEMAQQETAQVQPTTPEQEKRQIKISCHGCGQKLDLTHMAPFSIIECPVCNSTIIVPKWFDNYLLEEPGGIGGMATVYRALDLSLDREVAIKVLNEDLAIKKERGELFLHEARTAATINHFGVIPVYTCGEFESQPYIVMQFMEGGSLEDKLKNTKGDFEVKDVCRWIRDVAEGLDNAHRHSIIHHDIKPGNIMLDSDGNAKIGDFGIAQALHDNRTEKVYEITRTWLSPHYVSPEKVSTGKEDFQGDIYSLGATFYHLLTKKTPFDNEDIPQLIRARLFDDPAEPKDLREDIPEELSNLVMSMMDRDATKRPDYRAVVKAINYCLKDPDSRDTRNRKSRKNISVDKEDIKKKPKKKFKIGDSSRRPIKKKKSLVSYFYYLIMSCVLVGCLTYLVKTGKAEAIINQVLGNPPEEHQGPSMPEDLIPAVTWAFNKGNSQEAETLTQDVFEDVNADMKKRTQAGLQYALSKYLNEAPDATDVAFTISERLMASGLDGKDDLLSVIFFLANPEISPDKLRERLEGDKYLELLGDYAIFLRNMKGDDKTEIVDSFLKLKEKSKKVSDNYWGDAWHSRMKTWENCLRNGTGNKASLEPVFIRFADNPIKNVEFKESRSTTPGERKSPKAGAVPSVTGLSVTNIDLDKFKALREPLQQRPYIGSGTLDYDTKTVSDYIATLPENLRDPESRRFDHIKNTKDYFIRLFRMWEYRGPVKTKKKLFRNAKIALANKNGLFVKELPSGKSTKYSWNDLDFDQYVNFCKFFAKERLAIEGPNMTEDEQKRGAAKEYLMLSLLLDWHGWYRQSLEYAQKAVKVCPAIRPEVDQILLGK